MVGQGAWPLSTTCNAQRPNYQPHLAHRRPSRGRGWPCEARPVGGGLRYLKSGYPCCVRCICDESYRDIQFFSIKYCCGGLLGQCRAFGEAVLAAVRARGMYVGAGAWRTGFLCDTCPSRARGQSPIDAGGGWEGRDLLEGALVSAPSSHRRSASENPFAHNVCACSA